MKIDRVSVRLFTHTSRRCKDIDGHTHPGPPVTVTKALLTVAAGGVEGHAVGAPELLRPALLREYVRPTLLGRDPLQREALWLALAHWQRGSDGQWSDRSLALVDVALWDLNGKLLDAPVWKLAGGCRDRLPAYASTMCGDDIEGGLKTPADYAQFARWLRQRGYQAIKLHTWMPPIEGAPSVEMDVAACRAVREAVGLGVPLMLDANHWYSRREALQLGRAIQALDYTWLEEPMEESSIASYRWLSEQLDVPVIGPESAWGKHHMRAEWAASGACDLLRTGVNDVGGITPALKCMHLAESFGMECEVHGTGLANLAVSAACANSRWYERGLLHPLLDHEEPPEYLERLSDPMDAQGFVHLPDEPGLGERFNWDWIEAHTTGMDA